MRNRFLVSYDVCDPKRLRKMYKRMCGFGQPIQFSVFICPLSAMERLSMLEAIKLVIHHKEDRVMIADLGPADGRGEACVEFIGKTMALPEGGAIVV